MKKGILTKIGFGIVSLAFVAQLSMCSSVSAQTKNNGTYLKDTVINKVTMKLYKGAKGGRYVVVTSRSGSTYKRYFK